MARPTLAEMAAERWQDLTETERRFLALTEAGAKPDDGEQGADRPVIRAEVLRWLCTSLEARGLVNPKGIKLAGATVTGNPDLAYVDCAFALTIERCSFEQVLDLRWSRLATLRVIDCELPGLHATQMQVTGSMILDRSTVRGNVRLLGVKVGGNVSISDNRLIATAGLAVDLEGAHIQGSLYLKGTRSAALGGIRLFGINVRLNIECYGSIHASTGDALTLEQASVGGSVLFRSGFRSLGRVRIYEVVIAGTLDLSGARLATRAGPSLIVMGSTIGRSIVFGPDRNFRVGQPMRSVGRILLHRCTVGENVDLTGAKIRAKVDVALQVVDVTVKGRLIASRLDVTGGLALYRTSVLNDADFARITVVRANGAAILAIGLECRGSLNLEGARIIGFVDLPQLTVGREFSARQVNIEPSGSPFALRMAGATVGGMVSLNEAQLDGSFVAPNISIGNTLDLRNIKAIGVELNHSSIGMDFLLDGSMIKTLNQRSVALSLDFCSVQGSIFGNFDFICIGGLSLRHASVGGNVHLQFAKIENELGRAIQAESAKIASDLEIISCNVSGSIYLEKIEIGGVLDFSGSILNVAGTIAVSGRASSLRNGLSFSKGFFANGSVCFNRANIGGDIDLAGTWMGDSSLSFSLAAVTLEGDLRVKAFHSESDEVILTTFRGLLDLSRATIKGDVDLSSTDCQRGRGTTSVSFQKSRISGRLDTTDSFSADGVINLRDAHIHAIHDNEATWPDHGMLAAEGLTYESLHPADVDDRLRWLARQDRMTNWPSRWQPFEQLSRTLKNQGLDRDARKVMIAKEHAITAETKFRPRRIWLRIYGAMMNYGYEPQRALRAAPLLLIASSAIFLTGAEDLMVPAVASSSTQSAQGAVPTKGYPHFNAIAYSFDTLLPVVSLQQKEFWRVDDRAKCDTWPHPCGILLRIWLWFYIAAGWVITTLTVAGFTGLIRRT